MSHKNAMLAYIKNPRGLAVAALAVLMVAGNIIAAF